MSAQIDTITNANIIPILPGDTEEIIIAKAAHVVPNARQAKALENESIGFVHFGPNTFTKFNSRTILNQ